MSDNDVDPSTGKPSAAWALTRASLEVEALTRRLRRPVLNRTSGEAKIVIRQARQAARDLHELVERARSLCDPPRSKGEAADRVWLAVGPSLERALRELHDATFDVSMEEATDA